MRISITNSYSLYLKVLPLLVVACSEMQDHSDIEAMPWPLHSIDSMYSGADGVKLYDVDRDGRDDVVTGWEESGLTKLYLHPGPADVTQPWPGEVVGETPSVEDAVCCDLDGDGIAEVISSCEGNERSIVVFAKGHDTIWHSAKLLAAQDSMRWMYAECLQVDGKNGLDLIAGGKGENAALGWMESPEDPRELSAWKWHRISEVGWIMSLLIVDMNKDGEEDIVITDRKGDARGCRWLENPGPGPEQYDDWESHLVGAAELEVMFMDILDLNDDAYPELIVSERTSQTVRIFECLNGDGKDWKETVVKLPANIVHAKAVAAGRINRDEFPDLVISSNTEGKNVTGLIWLDGRSLFSGNPLFYPVSQPHPAKFDDVKLIDLNMDGDLDILTCEENFGHGSKGLGVIWYENVLHSNSE